MRGGLQGGRGLGRWTPREKPKGNQLATEKVFKKKGGESRDDSGQSDPRIGLVLL